MKNKILYFWCIFACLCLTPAVSFAQAINVEGTVEDESGETLIGVSVQIKDPALERLQTLTESLSCRRLPLMRHLCFPI